MLEGVVPFPPEFAQRYRERGYWADKSLAQEFDVVFKRYADRVALIDRERSFTYAEIDRLTNNLALNLLGAGAEALDRVVVQLPNVAEFVILYFALQKIGCIPDRRAGHASLCGNQPVVALSGASRLRGPGPAGRFRLRADGGSHSQGESSAEIWNHAGASRRKDSCRSRN